MATRTVSVEAAFFLPHLRPGMRVLDVGCGPGAITVGLAEAVAPGEVVGVDLQTTQVDRARALAAERGVANVHFEVADIYQLPFADGAFDAVFAHTVFIHLREPLQALVEMRRVSRPGGMVALRDPDFGAGFRVPETTLHEQRHALHIRVLHHNGGDPFVGRNYRRLLLNAGYTRSTVTASAETAGSLEETRRLAAATKERFRGFARTALAEGWISRETVEAIIADIDAWAERPDAFSVRIWCEAIGWNGG